MHDLSRHTNLVQSLAPAARSASANGGGVDLQGFDAAMASIHVGTWTDGTHTFELQESDDNATFTAVAADDLVGSEPVVDAGADASQIYEVGYTGHARYLRVAVTVAGATTGAVYGATIHRGRARHQPA